MADKVKSGIRVFVYCTLKAGHGNHRALEKAEKLGTCVLNGPFTLIDLGWFPGLIEAPSKAQNKVLGEVYLIDEATLAVLDRIEGHPNFYERKKIETPWKKAWAYMLPEDYLSHHEPIPATEGVQVWHPSEEELAHVRSA